jgi:hypothetical protein
VNPQVSEKPSYSPDSLIQTSLIDFGASGETRTLMGRFAPQVTKLLLSLLSQAGGLNGNGERVGIPRSALCIPD